VVTQLPSSYFNYWVLTVVSDDEGTCTKRGLRGSRPIGQYKGDGGVLTFEKTANSPTLPLLLTTLAQLVPAAPCCEGYESSQYCLQCLKTGARENCSWCYRCLRWCVPRT
jgi:hypothetical protein